MNKNTKRKLKLLRQTDKSYFKHRPKARVGSKGKVACLTYKTGERFSGSND